MKKIGRFLVWYYPIVEITHSQPRLLFMGTRNNHFQSEFSNPISNSERFSFSTTFLGSKVLLPDYHELHSSVIQWDIEHHCGKQIVGVFVNKEYKAQRASHVLVKRKVTGWAIHCTEIPNSLVLGFNPEVSTGGRKIDSLSLHYT